MHKLNYNKLGVYLNYWIKKIEKKKKGKKKGTRQKRGRREREREREREGEWLIDWSLLAVITTSNIDW